MKVSKPRNPVDCDHHIDPKTLRNPVAVGSNPSRYLVRLTGNCAKCGAQGDVIVDMPDADVEWETPRGPVSQTDFHLLTSLDVDAVGPSGLAARFSVAKLQFFLRRFGQPVTGTKGDLALRLSRAIKAPHCRVCLKAMDGQSGDETPDERVCDVCAQMQDYPYQPE